jgi:hypothetical protein
LTPNIGVSASGDADSTTKSAIASGTVIIRSGDTAAFERLSRDTGDSLNALGKIFDKKTVQEKQELAKVFGEEAFKAVGDLGLKEGSPEKAAIDAALGGIMAQLGGGSFASGAASSGITQLVMSELTKIKDPALLQWASAVVGAAAAKAAGGDAQTGASVAASQTKNNYLTAHQILLNAITGLVFVQIASEQIIKDKTGTIIATWSSDKDGFIDSYGNYLGNKWDDVTAWYTKTFSSPPTDTSVTNGPTVHDNPANNPAIGGTTTEGEAPASGSTDIPLGDPNDGTSTTIPQTQDDIFDPLITASIGNWNQGSFGQVEDSLQWHFEKHGNEVGAESAEQYLRKVEAFKQNLRGANSYPVDGVVPGVIRYVKNGKYIDLAPDGTVVSFGKR